MKLKTLLYLNEWFTKTQMGGMTPTSGETQLLPMPGGMNDVENWNSIREGNGWFSYRGNNDWNTGITEASVCITEKETPRKFWIKIKTRGLRKPNDTNKSYHERVRKHGDKVVRTWATEARRLHNEPKRLTNVGNKIMRDWAESFLEALKNPKISSLIAEFGETKITGYEKSSQAIADPVNFTPRI